MLAMVLQLCRSHSPALWDETESFEVGKSLTETTAMEEPWQEFRVSILAG